MRTLNRVLILAVLATACRQEPQPAPSPPPAPIEISVGQHKLTLSAPTGCRRFDHGREHRFRCSGSQVSLTDYGPVTVAGYLSQVRDARWLFHKGQVDDARALLLALPLRTAFDERQWREVSEDWGLILGAGRYRSVPRHEIDAACARIEHRLGSLKDPALLSIVQRVMPELDRAVHREIGHTQSLTVDGRPAVSLQTWDRLTHEHPKSYLVVLNDENLLVLGMGLGRFDEMEAAFDTLAASLQILPGDHSTEPAPR